MRTIETERPLEMVFVRHGESEANVAYVANKERGAGYSEEFRKKPNHEMELTPRGVEQAIAAGKWIRENIHGGVFNHYYVSPYRRTMHTAGHLHLPEGENVSVWKIRSYIREQSFGYMDSMPRQELVEKYPDIMALKDKDGVYWPRLGGESMADLVDRTKLGIIQTLYREALGQTGIVVAHGNLLWAVRIIMEGMTFEEYEKIDSSDSPLEKMNNCQVIQYSRINPDNKNDIEHNFKWMRNVCPWDTSLSNNEWRIIRRQKFSNQNLLEK